MKRSELRKPHKLNLPPDPEIEELMAMEKDRDYWREKCIEWRDAHDRLAAELAALKADWQNRVFAGPTDIDVDILEKAKTAFLSETDPCPKCGWKFGPGVGEHKCGVLDPWAGVEPRVGMVVAIPGIRETLISDHRPALASPWKVGLDWYSEDEMRKTFVPVL